MDRGCAACRPDEDKQRKKSWHNSDACGEHRGHFRRDLLLLGVVFNTMKEGPDRLVVQIVTRFVPIETRFVHIVTFYTYRSRLAVEV
jgi:hypothetical protein